MIRTAFTLQGSSVEEKLSHVETVLRRLLAKTAGAQAFIFMPPIPIFDYAKAPESDGLFFRYMLPADGEIVRFGLNVDRFSDSIKDKAAQITISLTEPGGTSVSQNFLVSKTWTSQEVTIPVKAGSKISAVIDNPMVASGLWTAMLYRIPGSQADKEGFLIEQLMMLGESDA